MLSYDIHMTLKRYKVVCARAERICLGNKLQFSRTLCAKVIIKEGENEEKDKETFEKSTAW